MKKVIELNKRAWDNIAKNYDNRTKQELSQTFKEFILLIPTNGKILDLGCGTGLPHTRYLVEKGFDVTGVDLSGEMVKIAMMNVPEATFFIQSMNEIMYEEEFQGVMSSFSMLLLTPELFKETASRIHSALKQGGFFYLSLNESSDVSVDSDSDVYVNIMGEEMYSRAYTLSEIEEVFLPLGFKVAGFNRLVHVSPEFGEEHVIEFIFEKE